MKDIRKSILSYVIDGILWFALSVFMVYRTGVMFPEYYNTSGLTHEMMFGMAMTVSCMAGFVAIYYVINALLCCIVLLFRFIRSKFKK